ncbi:MAG: hypothetical protein C0630_16445 [Sedimenticola selenatireducens]|uniref:Uncharacterized protein n=1 Tax=Sedimenticola selenatireducens TaxID=191960 RepID=A0A2N6CTC4_9GAMM|nr:MAG: hypothetical protein C0630_16445 [Sedimenticola selenatireducens]
MVKGEWERGVPSIDLGLEVMESHPISLQTLWSLRLNGKPGFMTLFAFIRGYYFLPVIGHVR